MKTPSAFVRLAAVGLVAGLSPALFAQPNLPTIDELIALNVRSLGGRAAVGRAGTLVFRGASQSTNPEEDGPVEIAVRSPKVAFRLGGDGLRMWFDGESAWRAERGSTPQKLPGKQFVSVVAVFDQARVLHWKELYPEIKPVAVRSLDGRQVYVIETRPGQPGTERIFLERDSGRVVRVEVLPNLTFTLSDYRGVDGLQVPFRIQQTTPANITYNFSFDEVKRTLEADDPRFLPR
jgi:hypothetical protein